MDCKIERRALVCAACLFLVTVCSCDRGYDYGNIVTPDVLAGQDVQSAVDVPALGEKVQISADWYLDSEGIARVRDMVESHPGCFVELDLGSCGVPSGRFGDSVIQDYAFQGIHNLGSVVLPAGMTTVPPGLFMDCLNLRTVTLPERLTSIEGHAFRGCVSLKEIYTSGNPLYIFSYAGDGLEHPDMEPGLKSVRVYYGESDVDYTNWYQYCWSYTKRIEPKKVAFSEIWASSFEDGYEPGHLADGTWGSWFEGESGGGTGTEILMHFTRMNAVSTITFRNGNGNTKNYWKSNRVRDMDIYFGNDPTAIHVTLADTCEKQTFRFLYGHRKMIQYDKVKFVVRSVYEGGGGNETCLAEISVNDEEMKDYVEDPYTRAMLDSIPLTEDEHKESVYRIWRPADSYPVMLMFDQGHSGEDRVTDSLRCLVYDGSAWTDAQNSVWSSIRSAESSARKTDKAVEYSFCDRDADSDFMIQLKRPVRQYEDAPYGTPYLFRFEGLKFVQKSAADFSMQKMAVDVKDFFDELERLSPNGIYRIDLKGVLDRNFFDQMQTLLAADRQLAINRSYILNMWECAYAPEMQDTLFADSICGYFIQLVLPESTKRILKSSVAVSADIISIPSGVRKIEAGAFISSGGSLYDSYPNSVSFDGGRFAGNYRLEGRLLLENPSSGLGCRVLLYCGNAGELLGMDDSSARSLVLPASVTEIAPYAFYGANIDSIVFPAAFERAGDKCFNMASVRSVDLSAVDVERFDMETARQFGLLFSSNPGVSLEGDFYCITATGRMTERLIEKINDEMDLRGDKKVYLDLSGTSLIWNDGEKKFVPLPEMFLYDRQNLYWLSLGHYNYLPQNTCRDCRQLRWVQFNQKPELIAEPSFKGCHATAMAIVDGESQPLWEYAQQMKY